MIQDLYKQKRSLELRWQLEYEQEGRYTLDMVRIDDKIREVITDVPNGMKYFERLPIQTKMEGDFSTGNVRYKARERYSFGVSDPRGIYGVEGA